MDCLNCGKRAEHSLQKRYHYRESGLDNLYLENIAIVHKCVCGQQFTEIPQVERLHDAIAYDLLNKKALWSGREFRFLRKWVGLTVEELGSALGQVSRDTVSKWERGTARITPATHHQMLLLVLRLKEDAINQRMYLEIAVREFLGKIAGTEHTPVPVTITSDTLKRLPFAASTKGTHRGVCV